MSASSLRPLSHTGTHPECRSLHTVALTHPAGATRWLLRQEITMKTDQMGTPAAMWIPGSTLACFHPLSPRM